MDDTTAPSRNSKGPKRLLVAVLVLLLLGVVLVLAARSSAPPKISVGYLGRVDQPGNTYIRLAITNTGQSLVFTSRAARIEARGNSNRFNVANRESRDRLRPGEGMITECMLSDKAIAALDGRWRVACYFASDGIRSRIYEWQWGANGRGPSVNWLVPGFLKGMPLTVIGTSEWNEPAPASSTVTPTVGH